MGRRQADGSDARFAAYVEELASVIGHADRVGPLQAYCMGLLLPCERKSVEPIAENFEQGPRAGYAGDATARTNRGMDY